MKWWQHAMFWAAWITVILLLAGCTTTRCVEVPRVRETVAHSRDTVATRDSIFVHDSVCVSVVGDTIYKERYHIVCRDRWRDRLRTDSFVQRDTVTVVKEVEKPPNRWQQARQQARILCVGFLVGLLLALAHVIYNRYIKAGK